MDGSFAEEENARSFALRTLVLVLNANAEAVVRVNARDITVTT